MLCPDRYSSPSIELELVSLGIVWSTIMGFYIPDMNITKQTPICV